MAHIPPPTRLTALDRIYTYGLAYTILEWDNSRLVHWVKYEAWHVDNEDEG